MSNKESNYERFANSSSFSLLLKKYRIDETGIWQIFGEDPNPDFGGCHSRPSLGFVEGTLEDVIEYAVELPNFWQWGAGGDIVKLDKVTKVDNKTVQRRKYLNERRAEYQEMIKAVDVELGKL